MCGRLPHLVGVRWWQFVPFGALYVALGVDACNLAARAFVLVTRAGESGCVVVFLLCVV
jgi:hypothetical protein